MINPTVSSRLFHSQNTFVVRQDVSLSIHFQYNTLMYGLFILSISFVYENQFIKSAIAYSILLNMKHIFLYVVNI